MRCPRKRTARTCRSCGAATASRPSTTTKTSSTCRTSRKYQVDSIFVPYVFSEWKKISEELNLTDAQKAKMKHYKEAVTSKK